MKKTDEFLLAFALGWFVLCVVGQSAGCAPPTQPSPITVNQINTQTVGGGLTNPDATAAQCLPSEETPIRVDVSVPDSVAVGSAGTIDATPKSANGKRSDGCNVLQGIAWTTVPTNVCHVKDPSTFTTAVVCDAHGLCGLLASVPGKGASGNTSVACQ